MVMTESTNTNIAYIGPTGAGFGFRLAGMSVFEVNTPEDMISQVRSLKDEGDHGIIFVDESLAESESENLARLNEDPLPAILLLPNPAGGRGVAAESLKQLIVKAVGSDILDT